MMPTASDVRTAAATDVPRLARTLALAFHDDPVMSWLLPDPVKRAKGLPRFFAAQTRHHHLAGGGVVIAADAAGTIGGAALWDPPGYWRPSQRSELCMLPAFLRAFGTRLLVGKSVGDTMAANHLPEPHWYLAVIGTDPGVRGTGYGQALMRSRLEICDAQQIPAYLESSNPDNLPYYERWGFTVTKEIILPNGGPPVWAMRRSPGRPV
ncbi:GNAT family N-acetyltransferase [Nocardia sp. NPDC052566]|uniref:GNAT family N-acetyltransferase n=1 Tax=Nocardia sp. NPDC052566 TaxID=3364330 RepID=UPI0037C74303